MKIRGPGGSRNDVGNTFFKMAPCPIVEHVKKKFHPQNPNLWGYLSYIINNIDNNNEKTLNM